MCDCAEEEARQAAIRDAEAKRKKNMAMGPSGGGKGGATGSKTGGPAKGAKGAGGKGKDSAASAPEESGGLMQYVLAGTALLAMMGYVLLCKCTMEHGSGPGYPRPRFCRWTMVDMVNKINGLFGLVCRKRNECDDEEEIEEEDTCGCGT